ncbi:cellobiose-binding protein [Nocardioides terrae]|uniref:Cellobiose-binding protein n=1 Tax=Nocardioides terrae TaxID=574651 RepID=A0A1I1NUK7_9ACTN|nr:extracellular solute-binding protein [Nocardioides terrae]SFD01351.1 cellobiose-binding protein [Nocardioides terrae]
MFNWSLEAGRRALRRGLALSATAVLLTGLAACGNSDDEAGSGGSAKLGEGDALTITTFGEYGYDKLIDEWNAGDHDFDVKQRKIGDWDDWKPELTTKLQAGSGLPDVVAIEGDLMPAILQASDSFVDLSDSSLDGRWLDFKAEGGTTKDGKMIGYATDSGPEAVCYRKDLFAKAGLPSDRDSVAKMLTTWDDYFATGDKFHKALPKTAWYDASGAIAQAMLNQVEFPFETADDEIKADNPDVQRIWKAVTQDHLDLSTKNKLWKADWTASFKDDGFATIMCPGWMRANIEQNAGGTGTWDVADVFPGGGGNWGGSYLAVPKQSKHQDQAKEFAAWITAPEQTARIFTEVGNFPSQVKALDDPAVVNFKAKLFGDAPYGQIMSDRAKAITVQPHKGPHYQDISSEFQAAIERVDEGSASPAESWKQFLDTVNAL